MSDFKWIDPDQLVVDPVNGRQDIRTYQYTKIKDSIRQHGIRQSVEARVRDGKLSVYLGGRRTVIAQELKKEGWKGKVPVIIKEEDNKTARALSFMENIQRDNYNPEERNDIATQIWKDCNENVQEAAKICSVDIDTFKSWTRFDAVREVIKKQRQVSEEKREDAIRTLKKKDISSIQDLSSSTFPEKKVISILEATNNLGQTATKETIRKVKIDPKQDPRKVAKDVQNEMSSRRIKYKVYIEPDIIDLVKKVCGDTSIEDYINDLLRDALK